MNNNYKTQTPEKPKEPHLFKDAASGFYVATDHGNLISLARLEKKLKRAVEGDRREIRILRSKGHRNQADAREQRLLEFLETKEIGLRKTQRVN